MALWDSFKKKIEKTYTGLDFWDKQENAAQAIAIDQKYAPAPTPSNTGGLRVEAPQPQPSLSVAAPTALPEVTIPKAPPVPEQPKSTYVGYDIGEGKNKTIFGWNAAAVLPKSLEKKYEVKTGREFQDTEGNLNNQYDKLDPEFRDVWLSQLDAKSKNQQDPQAANAQATLDALRRGGKLKGTAMDFIEGSNDKLAGGLLRGAARTVDWVIPGQNTAGLDTFANQMEGPNKVTDWGNRGEMFGTAQKGAVDVVSLVIPGAAVDKFAKGTKLVQMVDKAADANKMLKPVSYATKIVPGSLAGSGVDIIQEVGRGNDPNIARSLAVGTAADLALPAVIKPVAKVVGKGKNKIVDLLSKKADEVIEDTPINRLSQAAKNSLQNDTTGIKPNGVERSGGFVENGTARPIEIRRLEDGSITIVDGRHTLEYARKNGIKDFPIKDVTDQYAQPVVQNVPTPKPNSTKSMAELLQGRTFNKEITQDVDDLLAKQYGVDPATVRRLRTGYGDEQARNILASTSDATNIRDMNAFAISEARKRYGSPNVRINREPKPSEISPEELASLEKTAPVKGSEIAPTPTPVTPVVKETEKVIKESKLGSMAESFYDAIKGKNAKVTFRNIEQLGQKISAQINDDFSRIGSDYSEVARKVQEGLRNGAKTLDEAGLSPEEAGILRKAQAEMNYVRRKASLGNKAISDKDLGEMYIPQQKQGQYAGDKLFEGFRDTKPGSEFKRKNQIELEDLDYSPDVIGQYITRYSDTKLFREERIARAIAKNNPNLDEEKVGKAAQDMINLQDRVNALKTKITAGGLGRRVTQSEGKVIDTAAEMSTIGKSLDKPQAVITGAPKGLTNGDRINSVMIGDKTAGDYLGLNQWNTADNFASKQVTDAAGSREELSRMVEQRLLSDYNIHPDDIEYAVGGISRMANNLPDEVVLAKVAATYKQAAKQQLLEQLQSVDIKNPKLRKDISNLSNQILREGTIEEELSNKIIRTTLKTTNALFRKLNVSSAINELSDLTSFLSAYGKDTSLVPDFKAVKEFGLGDIDPAIEPYIKAIQDGNSLSSTVKKINKGTNLYKFVESYKAAVVASSAKKKYMAEGLTGDDLTRRVLEDYRNLALPVDAFTKTFLDNAPLYTQYMTWGVRNLQKEGRLATGKLAAGNLRDMTQMERVARNAYANLPAKTVFWLTSNGLKGTAILGAFGLTDFTGMTSQDYSGIQEQDKSLIDKAQQFTNQSTILSLVNKVYQSYEKEQLKEKYADEDYNPYEDNSLDKDIIDMFKPQFYKNAEGANKLMEQGFSENKGGRVQYEAPTDWWNTSKAYIFGKGNTENAREYSGRENLQDRVEEGTNPITGVIDMAKEQLGLKETDYNRPLTDQYSEAYKKADNDGRKALLQGGRAYNSFLDDIQRNKPEVYANYINSLKDNVNPEFWRTASGDGKDMTIFNMIRDRKRQLGKDLGTAYDPIYDLPDDQAKAVIQQKSVATGDDIALRNALYKEQWYLDYQNKVKGYYDSKSETDGDFEQTQRVKDWYALNDQYNGLRTTTLEDGSRPEWSQQFPTVYAQKMINQQYGFDSEQSKNFFKTYGDQYKAEKALYNKSNLDLINKMRAIEGYPPMSEAQFEQVSTVADTEDSAKKSSGYGSNSGGGNVTRQADFGRTGSLDLSSAKIKSTGTKIAKAYKPKAVKIQRSKKPR